MSLILTSGATRSYLRSMYLQDFSHRWDFLFQWPYKIKVKCTFVQPLRLCTGRTAHRGSRGIALPFHDHGTRRGWGVNVTPGRSLPPGKTRCQLYRRLGGPQGRSEQVRKISPPPGFDPRTVQPVASRNTDYATRPTSDHIDVADLFCNRLWLMILRNSTLTFRHRASCILGQAFHYSPENAFYIFNQQIYFIIWYLLDRVSLIWII